MEYQIYQIQVLGLICAKSRVTMGPQTRFLLRAPSTLWAQLFCVNLSQFWSVQAVFMYLLCPYVKEELLILSKKANSEANPLRVSAWVLIPHPNWNVSELACHPLLWNPFHSCLLNSTSWTRYGERSSSSERPKENSVYHTSHIIWGANCFSQCLKVLCQRLMQSWRTSIIEQVENMSPTHYQSSNATYVIHT